jgi:hypothetical protein
MLRRMFGFRREEVLGGLRRLHNDELHEVGEACSTHGDIRCMHNFNREA